MKNLNQVTLFDRSCSRNRNHKRINSPWELTPVSDLDRLVDLSAKALKYLHKTFPIIQRTEISPQLSPRNTQSQGIYIHLLPTKMFENIYTKTNCETEKQNSINPFTESAHYAGSLTHLLVES